MKIISKIIVWILSLCLVFIFTNLIIWSFKMKGVNNYIQLLDDKDWSATMSQVTILKPLSMFSIFSVGSDLVIQKNNNTNVNIQNTTNPIKEDQSKGENLDPYDPEFEDEFNSFFGGENTPIASSGILGEDTLNENINLKDTEDEQIEESHSVAQELIKKFNE